MYKIRNTKTGLFSKGRIVDVYNYKTEKTEKNVRWGSDGKTWTSEKTVQAHLLKMMLVSNIPTTWEIVKVEYLPTKPVADWVDPAMLMKVLKLKRQSNQ